MKFVKAQDLHIPKLSALKLERSPETRLMGLAASPLPDVRRASPLKPCLWLLRWKTLFPRHQH